MGLGWDWLDDRAGVSIEHLTVLEVLRSEYLGQIWAFCFETIKKRVSVLSQLLNP